MVRATLSTACIVVALYLLLPTVPAQHYRLASSTIDDDRDALDTYSDDSSLQLDESKNDNKRTEMKSASKRAPMLSVLPGRQPEGPRMIRRQKPLCNPGNLICQTLANTVVWARASKNRYP